MTSIPPPVTATDAHGRRFFRILLARVLWVVLAGAIVSLFVLGLPLYHDQVLGLTNSPVVGNPRALALTASDPAAMRDALRQLGLPVGFYAGYLTALQIAISLPFLLVGALIFWRKADEPAVWWLSLMLVSVLLVSPDIINALAHAFPAWHLLLNVVSTLGEGSFLLVFPLIFPDGRFVPRWARWEVAPALAIITFYVLLPDSSPILTGRWHVFVQVCTWLLFVGVTVYAPVYRYRHVASAVQRQQIKWYVFGTAGAIVGLSVAYIPLLIFPQLMRPGVARVVADLITGTAVALTFPLIPLSIGVAILRYHLWAIDFVLNRTLVYGALTVVVLALYGVTVFGVGALLQTPGNLLASLLATGFVALAFQPLRQRLQRGVNRLMFGERDDPARVLSRLGQRLEATLAPEAVLPTIAETVGQALKLPYVAVVLRGPEGNGQAPGALPIASYGVARDDALRLPLVYQRERMGELVLAPRAPGEGFGAADKRLLEDLARQIGVTAHAVLLTDDLRQANADLQASRERLVAAREEERRRLRRDLHDGLGPTLAALALKAGLVEDHIDGTPGEAKAQAAELKKEIRGAVVEIRRLVYALRPPSLDELGLLGALRELAVQMGKQTPPEAELHIELHAPSTLLTLPAAVEVAAYRIVQEALTNVVRHAHATHCTIHLTLAAGEAPALEVDVADDGVGMSETPTRGVGLRSMRERAAELGGSCEITRDVVGGTRIRASLPIMSAAAAALAATPAQAAVTRR